MKIDSSIAAVVTGGASGLGRASAQALAAAGVKVAVFDIDEAAGEALAKELGGVFCNVDIMSEESCEAGFAKARAAHGQERVVVHCAMVAGGGKTVGFDKTTGGFKRAATASVERAALGIFVASYRIASIAALGMANADPLNDDGERGCIILTSSAASQDGQIGQVAYGGGKGAVNAIGARPDGPWHSHQRDPTGHLCNSADAGRQGKRSRCFRRSRSLSPLPQAPRQA
jgi:NAD(P)-dependent dehydrogenase (short-subunit alcohol dehydrogenase family)